MGQESYTLREVAEILGVSRRTLQRRIQEGAFPGRYLSFGPDGPEMRIPARDLERALDEVRRQGREVWAEGAARSRAGGGRSSRELEPLAAVGLERVDGFTSAPAIFASALTQGDLESLRDSIVSVVREDREAFLGAVRDALLLRDREIAALREEVAGLRRTVEALGAGLEQVETGLRTGWRALEAPRAWHGLLEAGLVGGEGWSPPPVDVDGLLQTMGELEALLGGAGWGSEPGGTGGLSGEG